MMRFLMLMKPPHAAEIDAEGWLPSAEGVAAMSKYNQELEAAGVLLSLDGLHAPAEGVRVAFDGETATVTDGPYAETRELIGGFWILDVSSKAEAVEWAKRCPANGSGSVIEVRQIMEVSEFPAELRAAAGMDS